MPDSMLVFLVRNRTFLAAGLLAAVVLAFSLAAVLHAQVTAKLPATIAPPWDKGIQPINRDSYYNAIACGKQGGARPLCVFWDADLCKNPDFTLAFYTPYKQVAYEVWQAVTAHQPAPTPSYSAAERLRVTVGVTPTAAAKNPIASVNIKRGDRVVKPATQSLDAGGGRFIFDVAAFAPTEDITIELAGRARTESCLVEQPVLARFR
jgi:hypothetical protein